MSDLSILPKGKGKGKSKGQVTKQLFQLKEILETIREAEFDGRVVLVCNACFSG